MISQIPKWREEATLRYNRESLARQIADVKAGKTNCIYNPDPRLIDNIAQDAECAEKLAIIHIDGDQFPPDIAQSRYTALKKLPHLKTLDVYYAANTDAFLDDVQGMPSLEEIRFDCAGVSATGARHLTSCPNLKRIYFFGGTDPTVLDVLKDRPDIEILQPPSGR